MAHKKRERTRQQAKEKREFQKFMLIKVLPPPSLIFPHLRYRVSVSGRSGVFHARRARDELGAGAEDASGQETRAGGLQSW